jgi:hypothetical protein
VSDMMIECSELVGKTIRRLRLAAGESGSQENADRLCLLPTRTLPSMGWKTIRGLAAEFPHRLDLGARRFRGDPAIDIDSRLAEAHLG